MEAEGSKMQQIAAQPCVRILCYVTLLVVDFSGLRCHRWSQICKPLNLAVFSFLLFFIIINEDCDVIVSAEVTSYLAGNVSCLSSAFYLFLCLYLEWCSAADLHYPLLTNTAWMCACYCKCYWRGGGGGLQRQRKELRKRLVAPHTYINNKENHSHCLYP